MILFEVLKFAEMSAASLFCSMTNICTIISQIITLLHVSTLPCHLPGAYNQYLVKLHNKHTIISQINTFLYVSTISCHPQGSCNQYLAKSQVTTSQGIDYKLPEDDRIVSKHVGV